MRRFAKIFSSRNRSLCPIGILKWYQRLHCIVQLIGSNLKKFYSSEFLSSRPRATSCWFSIPVQISRNIQSLVWALQANVALIVMFNYFYTFQQLDPKELSEQLKRQGGSVQGIRPGRKTAEFITTTLNRMSLLGSGFLGLLAAAPAGVEAITKLQVTLAS